MKSSFEKTHRLPHFLILHIFKANKYVYKQVHINKIYEFSRYNFRGSEILPLPQNCVSDGINILRRHPVDPVS